MLLNIQALRALAAFLVVFVHLEVLAGQAGWAPQALEFGNGGVDLFFVISGVIMVFTTERRETTAASFFAHRVARIVPFYWFMTLAVFLIAALAPHLVQATRADAADLLRSLFFIPFRKSDGLVQPVVFVGWTLNYEMAFYLVFAAGMLLRRRLFGLALSGGVLLAAAIAGWAFKPAGTLANFYASPIILEFGFGMALGLVWRYLPAGGAMRFVWMGCALVALAALIASPSIWPDADRVILFGLPACVLVASALALERSGMVFATPLLKRLGDASYATYLSHFFVTQTATIAALALGVEGGSAVIAWFCGIFVVVGAVGIAVHYLIERPLSSLARRSIVGRPVASGAAATLPV